MLVCNFIQVTVIGAGIKIQNIVAYMYLLTTGLESICHILFSGSGKT